RRVVNVSLTSAGKKLASDVSQVRKVHAVAVLGALDESDRKRLLDIMAKLADNLSAKRPSGS
ncbi:MAG: hypothetical protein KAJ01_10055, partial [Candidatus Hydrogenedentes bacterium]|nr:hypothetical protein [Candidatus Hydrogenedentota bacterium]